MQGQKLRSPKRRLRRKIEIDDNRNAGNQNDHSVWHRAFKPASRREQHRSSWQLFLMPRFSGYLHASLGDGFGNLCASSRRSPAASVIQIDELVRFRDMADDIEFANGFLLRGPERYPGGRVTFAMPGIFRPLPRRSQIFERVVIFDENVQGRHFNRDTAHNHNKS